ncbi:MAG: DUF2783 domain-containing protein [Pseudomonadota bacterium]
MAAHDGLSEAGSQALNARLGLILAESVPVVDVRCIYEFRHVSKPHCCAVRC